MRAAFVRFWAWLLRPLCPYCRQPLDECRGDWPIHE